MGNYAYVDVNGKLVKQSDVTYDELVILGKQFYDIHGEFPNRRNSKPSNNIPTKNIIVDIIKKYNKTYLDFLKDIGCDNKKILCEYMNETQRNLDFFPVELFDGTVLNYDKSDDGESMKTMPVHLHDQYGYKYHTNRAAVRSSMVNNTVLRKFNYVDRIYLIDNIYNYFKTHQIEMSVIHIPQKCSSTTPITFATNNGDTLNIPLDYIVCHPERYSGNRLIDYININKKLKFTKKDISNMIIKKEQELQRPLIIDDLKNLTDEFGISYSIIQKYWGTFNKMKNELGLLFHGNTSLAMYKTHCEYMDIIDTVCRFAELQNRKIIMIDDFKKVNIDVGYQGVRNYFKRIGSSIRNEFIQRGYQLQDCGGGINYKFDDGEFVRSSYELDFSTILRKHGLIYNRDYFRDVLYSNIDNNYNGNMNCDYLLIRNDRKKYVELAGLLSSNKHLNAYINNIPINDSESKELYRRKLRIKYEILSSNLLDFEIILKPNLNINYYKSMIDDFWEVV